MDDLRQPLTIACHDAGATNHIVSWVKADSDIPRKVFAKGPAKKIWADYFPDDYIYEELEDSLVGSNTLLSGSGWATDLEYEAIKKANSKSINSIAVLDHWVNYRERFTRNEIEILPNEIWVTDEYAFSQAKKEFEQVSISLKQNYYLQAQVKMINKKSMNPKDVLYLLEPVREKWNDFDQGEFCALNYFIRSIEQLTIPLGTKIRLRPHPSDSVDKYNSWIEKNQDIHYKVILDDCIDIAESIAEAKWVVGCRSYALVIALQAGKQVISSIPPNIPTWKLPHKDIQYLK